jgi:chromosome segregation ATPase
MNLSSTEHDLETKARTLTKIRAELVKTHAQLSEALKEVDQLKRRLMHHEDSNWRPDGHLRALLRQLSPQTIGSGTTQLSGLHESTKHEITEAEQILSTHGLHMCARQLCDFVNISTMEDLKNLSDDYIDTIRFLRNHQPDKLKALCQACREGDPDYMKEVMKRRMRS